MSPFGLKLLGYVVVTAGAFIGYLIWRRDPHKPRFFTQLWVEIVISLVSLAMFVVGYFLLTGKI